MEIWNLIKQHQENVDANIQELPINIIHLIEESQAIIHITLEQIRQDKEMIERLVRENLRLENDKFK